MVRISVIDGTAAGALLVHLTVAVVVLLIAHLGVAREVAGIAVITISIIRYVAARTTIG